MPVPYVGHGRRKAGVEALQALCTICQGTWLHFITEQGLSFGNWGTQHLGLMLLVTPAPVLTFFPTHCLQPPWSPVHRKEQLVPPSRAQMEMEHIPSAIGSLACELLLSLKKKKEKYLKEMHCSLFLKA